MIRDDIIIAFAKLRAARRDARAELLAAAADLPPRQCAAIACEVEAIAALFEATCPAPTTLSDRPPAEERTTRLTKRERVAQRRYFKEFAERLSAQLRAR